MHSITSFDLVRSALLGLYAIDDPADALDTVFDVAVLAGTPIVDAATWFPRWEDDAVRVHLATDTYSYAARENLVTHLAEVLPAGSPSPLDLASKEVEFSDDPIRLGLGVADTAIGRYAVLAACVDSEESADTAVIVAVGDETGDLSYLIRLRTSTVDADNSLAEPILELAHKLARICCGSSAR